MGFGFRGHLQSVSTDLGRLRNLQACPGVICSDRSGRAAVGPSMPQSREDRAFCRGMGAGAMSPLVPEKELKAWDSKPYSLKKEPYKNWNRFWGILSAIIIARNPPKPDSNY